MKWKAGFMAVALGAMSGALMARQATSSHSTLSANGAQTVSGSVVQYSPGQSIVLRTADGKTTTYRINSNVQVPAGVAIGRDVTLSTQANGSQSVVTRVDVKTSNPADSSSPSSPPSSSEASRQPVTYTSTETSSPMAAAQSSSGTSSSGPSSTQSGSAGMSSGSGQSSAIPPSSGLSSGTSPSAARSETTQSSVLISGKVTAYQPKQSITIEQPGKGTVTYVIDTQSDLPQDIAVGKTVTITTRTVQGSSKPVVRTVTTTTTTRKTSQGQPPQ